MRFQSIPKIAQFICTLLVVYMAFYGIAQATMAPAGIDINNTATSEYINDRGQNKTTESNTVTIKVLPVFSATLFLVVLGHSPPTNLQFEDFNDAEPDI